MKYVPYFIVIIIAYVIIGHFVSVHSNYIIPKEAIRVRVIANSNDDYDQRVKSSVKDIVEKEMYGIMSSAHNLDDAKTLINSNIPTLSKDIEKYLEEINYKHDYNVNYGYNFFPQKEYKGVEYKEGMYESLVVTLGSGKGDNWWCVLFPPICMIEAEESTEIEYTTFIKDIVNKYF